MTNLLAQNFAPSPDAVDSEVGDEAVILHLGNNTYYGLDPLGTRIWALLKEGQQPASIFASILGEYDVTAEVLEADMRGFLQDLLDNQILVTQPD